jgi:putative Mg2+ transporter-C (MgtC) family protein
MSTEVWLEIGLVLRLGLAAVLGAIIGAQREIHGSPAGLRTHLLVAFGSALFTILSAHPALGVGGLGGEVTTTFDPTRIAAQIVTGIGFIGAGAILKDGATIRGLTTAASLWAVAAIGMAVGFGAIILSIAATAIILISLGPLAWLSHRLSREAAVGIRARLRVTDRLTLDELLVRLSEEGAPTTDVATQPTADGRLDVLLTLEAENHALATRAMATLIETEGVEVLETNLGPADV